jgi:NADPH-dependent 2,4-dienoyl-CoA reductase/sulfur reductase-like enzyme/nitrite reductase/ring-hydroxylating ferredoxin subunit
MSSEDVELTGPDLERGVPLSAIPDGGKLAGHGHGKAVLLVRQGDAIFAVGASCTHYGGPLAEGLVVGESVRCPWHHACFDLRTGEPVRAPALKSLPRFSTEIRDGLVFVTAEVPSPEFPDRSRSAGAAGDSNTPARAPASIVIIGAGAAGDAAADMLRRQRYDGPITIIGADTAAPYDRPNISKDYLAGTAPEDWIPLRPADFHTERKIDLRLQRSAVAIDTAASRVTLDDGSALSFGALLLATGSSPVRLPPAADPLGRVHYLRTLDDSRSLIAAAGTGKRVVILGASFIGLEVAASLRTRGLDVHVVAPEQHPLGKILGPQLGDFVRTLHESHGVVFHLSRTAGAIAADSVTLDNGERLTADLVVAGIGVRPNEQLASQSGIRSDRGVLVDEYLETSARGVFAAGDVARYIDARSGERIRVEHWVVAQRMGQTAARNMLGQRVRFAAVPFFWSQHYDVAISYVGHAERWDDIRIDGSVEQRDCAVSYMAGGRVQAVATIGRDLISLETELGMERRAI